mgnify:CR=1 FL=1
MKKKGKIILSAVLILLIILIVAMSYFIGTQVFEGSTQLVTNEDTKGVRILFGRRLRNRLPGHFSAHTR